MRKINSDLITDILDTIVRDKGNNIAIEDVHRSITYTELDQRSNQITNFFLSKGIQKGDVIGLCMDLSIEYVIAMLAVIKSGCVFIPISRKTPEKRLEAILNISKPALVIEDNAEQIIKDSFCFITDKNRCTDDANYIPWFNFLTTSPNVLILQEDPIYIFFTSGTTGTPKAIVGKHCSLVHYIKWESEAYNIDDKIKVGALTPTTFDPSLRDIFVSLFNGATLYIPNQKKIDFTERLRWLIDKKINLIHIVPSVYEKFHDELGSLLYNKEELDLKYIFFAGEPLYAERIKIWKRLLPSQITLVNLYGPTETTLAKLYHHITEKDIQRGGVIPLGKPLPNTTIYIVDDKNEKLSTDKIGEIVIQTNYSSLGYLQKELNADKFIQIDNEKLGYKTGDLGKINQSNEVEYHGRVDFQIKINGIRIEIGEIESVLLKHDDIDKCCILFVQESDLKHLIAFFHSKTNIAVEELRKFMLRYLSPDMVPAEFVQVEDFPYNSNGKIDRVALSKQYLENISSVKKDTAEEYHYSELEQSVHDIWAEVLKKEKIGPDENFFSIGGHSLNGLVIISKVCKVLNISFEVVTFFNNPTIRSFAKAIQTLSAETHEPLNNDTLNVKEISVNGLYPASNAQKMIYVQNEITGNSSVYNIYGAYNIRGKINDEALSYAVKELIKRHESLRTSFVKDENGNIFQQIHPAEKEHSTLIIHNLSSNKQCYDLLEEEFSYSFDLKNDLLLRIGLLIKSDNECVLFYCMHHIISDGWSLEIFIRDLLTIYEQKISNKKDNLIPLQVQYKNYVTWEIQKASALDNSKKYWLTKFSGELPTFNFPTNFSRPTIQTYAGDSFKITIPFEIAQQLRNISKTYSTTYFTGLLTVLYTLLYRYSGQDDIIIGSPVANRDHVDWHDQIGLYVNTIAYRVKIKAEDTFYSLLDTVKNTIIEGNQHKHYPFDQLLENINIKRDLSRNPLFSVMANFQTEQSLQFNTHLFNNIAVDRFDFPQIKSKFDFSFYFLDIKEKTDLMIIYNTDLFTKEFMQNVLQHFLNLAKNLSEQPNINISHLQYLSAAEEKKIIEDFNDTGFDQINNYSIIDLFTQCAHVNTSKPAIIANNIVYSYTYINEKSNQLANYLLLHYSINKNDKIIISLGHNEWLPIAILATLKLNAVYIPIEVSTPILLKEKVKSESECLLIIDNTFIEKFQKDLDDCSIDNIDVDHVENRITTIIYTTGSTGNSKGVIIGEDNILNRLEWMWKKYPFQVNEVCALKTSISFVDHIWELFGPLLKGIPLVCFTKDELLNIPYLIRQFNQYKVSHIVLVPSLLKEILEYPKDCKKQLSQLVYWTSSGEELSKSLIKKFYDIFNYNTHTLLNIYGSTEVTADATCYDTSQEFKYEIVNNNVLVNSSTNLYDTHTNIGKPISNVKIYILDNDLKPVPIGVEGVIFIGGKNVTKGYFNDEELTKNKFIISPFDKKEILFRTDDIGKWLPDGNVMYIGRKDYQFKVRGNRINTQYIEKVIANISFINQAVVVFKHEKLVAYITAYSMPRLSDIRVVLKQHLPEYMMPSQFICIEKFPQTSSGKIDRKKLTLELGIILTERTQQILPQNDVEHKVYELWKLIFRDQQLSMHDDFFSLGGHSLHLMRLVQYYYKQFGVQLNIQDLFIHTTISGHCTLIQTSENKLCVHISKAPQEKVYPLSDGQRRLWSISQSKNSSLAYHMSGAFIIHHPLQIENFISACNEVIKRHESLRTNFIWNNGTVYQAIRSFEHSNFAVEVIDASNQSDEDIKSYIEHAATQPFELTKDCLFRTKLFKRSSDEYIFYYCIHHIISDLKSMKVLARDILHHYHYLSNNTQSPMPPLKLQYKDFAVWQQSVKEEIRKKGRAFYSKKLKDIPVLNLPTDYIRPRVKSYTGNTYYYQIPQALYFQLKQEALAHGTTPFSIVIAAINTLIYCYTQQEDVTIGIITEGRMHPDLEDQIGFFVNTIPLRTQFNAEEGFKKLCAITQRNILECLSHQAYSLDDLIDDLHIQKNNSRSSLFDIIVTYENYEEQEDAFTIEPFEIEKKTAQFDLTFGFTESKDNLCAKIEYSTDLYDKATIERMSKHLMNLLGAALSNKEEALYKLDYLTVLEKNSQFV